MQGFGYSTILVRTPVTLSKIGDIARHPPARACTVFGPAMMRVTHPDKRNAHQTDLACVSASTTALACLEHRQPVQAIGSNSGVDNSVRNLASTCGTLCCDTAAQHREAFKKSLDSDERMRRPSSSLMACVVLLGVLVVHSSNNWLPFHNLPSKSTLHRLGW